MQDRILVGRGKKLLEQPFETLRRQLDDAFSTPSPRLDFMTPEHHLVRDAAVTELPRQGSAVSPESLADRTGLSVDRVNSILGELEARLFFLVRDDGGRVSWAFPVTSETTPHELTLSTGETVSAA